MLENHTDSKYTRILENLALLESRNPDLGPLVSVLDEWLNNFVQRQCIAASSVPSSSESPSIAAVPLPVNRPVESSVPTGNVQSAEATIPDRDLSDVESCEPLGMPVGMWRSEEIDQLERRLLLKIEASRWALERDRLLKSAVDFQSVIEPRDHALLARARELTNCYLWMNNPETAPVIATETYEMLADAYRAAAVCVGFLRELTELADHSPKSDILSRILRDALYITATAQSSLRRVTYEVSGREDQDQIRIHRWLTVLTKRYSIYVNRHMKKDSLAPKDRIYIIPEYIGKLRTEVEKLGQRQKILSEGFRRIQYHASRVQVQPGSGYDWAKIIDTVDDLVDAGIPASDSRFRDSLKTILGSLKTVPSYKEHPFFINVLMELDFWHENEAEKAIVEQELTERPPQPSVRSSSENAEEYQSVWDEMERSVGPGKILNDDGQMNTSEVATPNSNQTSSRPTEVPSGKSDLSAVRSSKGESESAFASYSNSRRASQPSFGAGILGAHEETPSASPAGRFGSPRDVPSYLRVVSEKAHTSVPDGVLEQAKKIVRDKTVLLVDGNGKGDRKLRDALQKDFGMNIAFAAEEQISSEARLAQLVHPGSVALVLMVEGSVPTSNRNVENYCRHFDKPILRIGREVNNATLSKQIIAAMTLWSGK